MNKDDERRRFMITEEGYNESFRGEVLNEEKLEKLNRMKKLCRDIAQMEPRIEAPFVPFDKTNRHGMAMLYLPYFLLERNHNVCRLFAALLSVADATSFSARDGEHIRVSFFVYEMWDKFRHEGYDYNE